MSDGFNKAILIGRLGADPELRHTTAGRVLLKLRLATNESWKDAQGEKKERVDWHSVVIWGKRAEALNGILSKGRRIGVEGRIRTSKFEGKDGAPRKQVDIEATNVVLLDGPRGQRSLESGSSAGYAPDLDAAEGGDDIPF